MNFHWNWCSYQGSARAENQDYAGIALGEDFLFAIVADGVSSRSQSGELAHALVATLVNYAAQQNRAPERSDVIQWIEDAFHKLKRERDLKSATAFLAAVFVRERLLFSVHAGDCRIGLWDKELEIAWKTPVHSVATAIRTLSEAEMCAHPARNQLTRTFNSKRACVPELIELNCLYKNGAILATDGYWAELSAKQQKIIGSTSFNGLHNFNDDASRLLIYWDEFTPEDAVSGKNLYINKSLTE